MLYTCNVNNVNLLYIFFIWTIYWFYQAFILFYICKYMYIFTDLVHIYIFRICCEIPLYFLMKEVFFLNHENCWWYKKPYKIWTLLHSSLKQENIKCKIPTSPHWTRDIIMKQGRGSHAYFKDKVRISSLKNSYAREIAKAYYRDGCL